MNWSKIKTILILLFLCTDVFLLSTIISLSKREITPEIIKSTVSILDSHGIKIDENIIPRKTPSVYQTEGDNIITDYLDFARLLCGDDAVLTSGNNAYTGKYGKLTLTGDSFAFSASGTSDISYKDEKSAISAVTAFLKKSGFDMSLSKPSAIATQGGFDITYQNYAHNLPVFNSKLLVSVSGGKITSISGNWFNTSEEKGQASELKNVTGILIDFIKYINAPEKAEISSLELGYSIFEYNTYHKSAVLVPSWCITLKDGRKYFLDARNAQ